MSYKMKQIISRKMRIFILTFLSILSVSTSLSLASPILFIDDDEGLSGETTWFDALSNLGYTYDSEVLGLDADPLANLSDYSAVIWSIGDRAFANLTEENVQAMQSYLEGGGSLLYSGGMSLYSEPHVGSLAADYFGLGFYAGNLSIFGNTTMNGTGNSFSGTSIYTVSPWLSGEYGSFMSGFQVTTAQSMFFSPGWSTGGPYVAAVNVTSDFIAMTWGFDINHISDQTQREQLLGTSLAYLSPTALAQSQEELQALEAADEPSEQSTVETVPEPAPLILFGLGLLGLGLLRKRRN